MAVDLYLRIPTDPNYSAFEVEVDVDIQNFLQQIEMILTTRKGDVLGDPDFGANLEDYVWSNYSSSEIETELNQQISLYCSDLAYRIPYKIEVGFVQGEIYDTIVVDITLDGTKVLGVVVSP
jgi:hypothetical protein